jgi:hypothetical protein
MATITVTNLDTTSVTYLSDFYSTLDKAGSGGANISRTFIRGAGEIPLLNALMKLQGAGKVSVVVTPTSDEIASGLLSAPASVQAGDVAAVDAVNTGVPFTGRLAFTAAGSQNVPIYPPGTEKFPGKKFRITRAWARVATASAGTTLSLRTLTGGAGTLLAQIASAATGVNQENTAVTASAAVDMSDGVSGLFLYKSSAAPGGEIFWEGVLE